MAATAKEVGPLYDLLLATRDGSNLSCLNKEGQAVAVSSLAFMTSVSAQNTQREETELTHKDQIIQLASPNLSDREFEQWPQVSQGDWSGGIGQRVFTGATPITGGVQSDPTRYWDDLGLLWPTSDYQPQQGVLANPDQGEAGNNMNSFGPGTVAGFVQNLVGANSLNAFAYMYQQSLAPNNNILVLQGDGVKVTATNPPGTAAATQYQADFIIAFGQLWYLVQSGANILLDTFDGSGAFTNRVTLNAATFEHIGMLAAGMVGNIPYIAFGYVDTGSSQHRIRLIDMSPGNMTANATDVPLFTAGLSLGIAPLQLEFLGDNLILSMSLFDHTVLMQFNIPSRTWTTLARFPASSDVYYCVIAGSIFAIVTSESLGSTISAQAELWLIQGTNAQDIGPLTLVNPNVSGALFQGAGQPGVFGPYAIFPIYYRSASANRVSVFAYDVLRGRLFKFADFTTPSVVALRRMGILSNFLNHPFGGGTIAAQWAALVPMLAGVGGFSSAGPTNVQRVLMGVSNGGFQPYLQQGVQITSSLIDFTSATNKLYRQVIASFTPLPNDANITVKLDAWLDQDPANLNAAPDFTISIAGGPLPPTGPITQLKLSVNKVARKLVYRITTTGPSTTFTPAVKLQSVIVRAATGWARTMVLDLADNVRMNGTKDANMTCWTNQQVSGQPAIDGTVAYNFLRQLWRLQGGEVVATFPNGDASANWLLQDEHFDSPKPFGVSFRADQRNSLSYICTLKMREDI